MKKSKGKSKKKARPAAGSQVPAGLYPLIVGLFFANGVFNLAYDFRQSAEENLRNFGNLTDLCVEQGAKRLVHISSIVVYYDWPEGI